MQNILNNTNDMNNKLTVFSRHFTHAKCAAEYNAFDLLLNKDKIDSLVSEIIETVKQAIIKFQDILDLRNEHKFQRFPEIALAKSNFNIYDANRYLPREPN